MDPVKITEEFAKMLIAQIQNQDPTDPMDPTEIVTQNAQMLSSIGSARLANQMGHFEQVGIASSSIGKQVIYTDATGMTSMGLVQAADFTKSTPYVVIDGKEVPIGSILQITS